jgi:hypothetical protein
MMDKNQFSDILNTVIENGRVSPSGREGYFDRESLIVEVEFEAGERGLNDKEIAEAVEFALRHAKHD